MLKPNEQAAGMARSDRARRGRAEIMLTAGLCAALLMIQPGPGLAAGNSANTAKYWKGKNISEVQKKFGNPTQMTPLVETGGTLYIYAHKGEPHWAFETDPGGRIVKAARIE
jgi:hypothetical protein